MCIRERLEGVQVNGQILTVVDIQRAGIRHVCGEQHAIPLVPQRYASRGVTRAMNHFQRAVSQVDLLATFERSGRGCRRLAERIGGYAIGPWPPEALRLE